jgi:flagellar L-ring protein precursor FlgH
MMTFRTITVLILTLSVLQAAHADSLYSPPPAAGTTAPINYFTDDKAHNVGDLLTVEISESSSGSSTASTSGSKNESASISPGTGAILRLIHNFGLADTMSSAATGTSTRADTLSATMSVVVKQVLPNGNLVIEGTRLVGTNAEAETITLTGVVRPADISSTNTVQSPLVADAQIKYSGKGPVAEIQHDGLVRQLFKYIF